MKLKAYHSILIFAILVMFAVFSSVSNYRKAQYAIVQDMNKALAQTLQENKYQWITPDTIQNYRSHLSIDLLKSTSNLCYVMEDRRRNKSQLVNSVNQLSSKEMLLNEHSIQSYANCSMADVFCMSNQRTSLALTIMAMIWAIASLYYHRRKQPWNHEADMFGTMSYSQAEDFFYNQENGQSIKFTPMQHQLMQLFFNNTHHQLSKQEICNALWPKKPDASETLYTLIRRIKPVIEQNSNLMIESERGKSYRLIIR